MNQELPAGLNNANTEFYVSADGDLFCISDRKILEFDQFGKDLLLAAERQLEKYPKKIKALPKMTGSTDPKVNLKQYICCNQGLFDNKPDIVDGVMQPSEYAPCPKRGTCKYDGVVCDGLLTDSGEYLTKREIQIVSLIAEGALDKNISDKLNLKISTIATHTRNIRRKTRLYRKADITRFAINKYLT